ncbi:MAG: sensor histidine kinase [Pseudobutyrivibrio sp.]|nr:sensor histidine kinase [Pseudobutyrivibrio sp.]
MKKNHRLRNHIIGTTSFFILVIGLMISSFSYLIYSKYVEDNLKNSTDTSLRFLVDYLDNELDNIDQLVQYCKTNSSIVLYVESHVKPDQKRIKAYDALDEYCMSSSFSKYLHRVMVTNLSDSYIQIVAATYSSTINVARELLGSDLYTALSDKDYKNYNYGFMTDPYSKSRSKTVVPVLEPITYSHTSDLGGYVFIEVDQSLFTDALANNYRKDSGDMILTLGENNYRYTSDGKLEYIDNIDNCRIITEKLSGSKNGTISTVITDNNQEYTVITEPLQKEGCYVSQVVLLGEAKAEMLKLWQTLLVLFGVLIVLAVGLNTLLNKSISQPVEQINGRLKKISEGDFSRDEAIEWNHELGEIGKGVNDLAENISQLIDTRIENEKQKKDLEYKVLQSQINPHFIYNTLNSIKWMAQIQGASGIVDMTTALARLLKSISKGTKLQISLEEELSLVEDYFTIQRYRYGGTIELVVNVKDKSLLECQIIKFTLQPLVENAIFHGIEPKGMAGTVTIDIYEDEDKLLAIDVIDDGVGMDKKTAIAILWDNNERPSDFFKEIGVSNVHKRLQYEFGLDYGVTVDSELGEYTCMKIRLPQRKNG